MDGRQCGWRARKTINAFDAAVLRVAMRQLSLHTGIVDELFDYLRDLDLPTDHFAVFGSGPLIVRGWVKGTNDLDVICRGSAWEKACAGGIVSCDERYDVSLASHCSGRVTFGTSWGIGEFDVDELINTSELIDGLPFVRLEHVIEYKQVRSSPKDLLHLEQYKVATSAAKTRS